MSKYKPVTFRTHKKGTGKGKRYPIFSYVRRKGGKVRRKGDYYEKTETGWMLHSQIVKMRRSIGQSKRYSKRRVLKQWMKECKKHPEKSKKLEEKLHRT
jgi:hypothetical protein